METDKMSGDDNLQNFRQVRIAILTVSDSRTSATDTSGDILADRITSAGHIIAAREIARDEEPLIAGAVSKWINDDMVDVVITTGGTGLTGRDVTPEALKPLFEKEIDGFSAIFHQVSFESIGLSTIQSRAMAGIAKGTIVFALPGSNGAVKDGWDKIISHQLDARYRPCNLVELMPRLLEK